MGAVGEKPVCAADGDVEDEVEALVKGGVARGRVAAGPGVVEQGGIFRLFGKVALFVEVVALFEADKEDLVDLAVNVEVNVVLGPLDAVGVEAVAVVAAANLFGVCGFPVGVCVAAGA